MNNKAYIDEWVEYKDYESDFIKPNNNTLGELKVGYSVKINNSSQRFWVTITKIDSHFIVGKVDNKIGYKEYKLGDLVIFSKKHIHDILTTDRKLMIQNKRN